MGLVFDTGLPGRHLSIVPADSVYVKSADSLDRELGTRVARGAVLLPCISAIPTHNRVSSLILFMVYAQALPWKYSGSGIIAACAIESHCQINK